MTYVVRAQGDPAALTGQIRSALAQMTPYVALAAVRTFEEVVATANRTSGLLSWLSVLFGVLAAALAILGIYSVMSYTVAQRERELAIRAAVGASRSSLLSMVLREGLMLSGAGIAAGAVIALAASGVLRSLLYDVSATDPMVFVGSAVGLAAIAIAGYLIPAARASRVEPVSRFARNSERVRNNVKLREFQRTNRFGIGYSNLRRIYRWNALGAAVHVSCDSGGDEKCQQRDRDHHPEHRRQEDHRAIGASSPARPSWAPTSSRTVRRHPRHRRRPLGDLRARAQPGARHGDGGDEAVRGRDGRQRGGAVDLDYETVGGNGSMLMVTVSGTAVVLQ